MLNEARPDRIIIDEAMPFFDENDLPTIEKAKNQFERQENCLVCEGEGLIEEYGDGENFEWDVIGTHPCPGCNN